MLAEAKYLKLTVSPDLRFRRKVGNKFVKYKMDEIKGQILALLAPSEEFIGGIEEILKSLGIKHGYFLSNIVY